MPLRDHFGVSEFHRRKWTRLHAGWPMKMVEWLKPRLPAGYISGPGVHIGRYVPTESDVGAYRQEPREPGWSPDSGEGGGGTATAVRLGVGIASEPIVVAETDSPDDSDVEVRVYEEGEEGRERLVAAIEIVSPSNKDRPASREKFLAKCTALLKEEVSVTLVDLVTERRQNLFVELLHSLGAPAPRGWPGIYAATCRYRRPKGKWLLEAWGWPMKVGEPLPVVPLWLGETLGIDLELEPSYEATCGVLDIT